MYRYVISIQIQSKRTEVLSIMCRLRPMINVFCYECKERRRLIGLRQQAIIMEL